eukprot:1157789-Pelagomonas_calceolata.AAC.3
MMMYDWALQRGTGTSGMLMMPIKAPPAASSFSSYDGGIAQQSMHCGSKRERLSPTESNSLSYPVHNKHRVLAQSNQGSSLS